MRIAVTGATGFLGRHVVRVLADHDVVALSRHAGPGITVADVTDATSMAAAVHGCDVVVHAAGKVDHHASGAKSVWAVHVDGTKTALQAAHNAGVKRFVHLSTSGTVAVAKDDRPRSEDDVAPIPLITQWPYYRSKKVAEDLVMNSEMEVVCLCPSLLLGPGDVHGTATAPVRRFLRRQVPVAPPGGLSFVDVRDVADAVAQAVRGDIPAGRYLLGAANWSFAEFYGRLSRIADLPAPALKAPHAVNKVLSWFPAFGANGMAPGVDVDRTEWDLASHYWYLSDARARATFGWSPRDPLQTLSDTVGDLWQRGLA